MLADLLAPVEIHTNRIPPSATEPDNRSTPSGFTRIPPADDLGDREPNETFIFGPAATGVYPVGRIQGDPEFLDETNMSSLATNSENQKLIWPNDLFLDPNAQRNLDEYFNRLLPDAKELESFRIEVVELLREEPIEDGVAHPAETIIEECLAKCGASCLRTMVRAFEEYVDRRPSISASILRCIGRLDLDQAGDWGMRVARQGLSHQDIEVREAAVRALEGWGDRESLGLLGRHRDSVPWMNDYVQQVIADLTDTLP